MTTDPALAAGLHQAFGKRISAPLQAFLRDRLAPGLLRADASQLALTDGQSVPIVNHVPRFVPHDNYAGSFSFQWDAYQATQLDSAQKAGQGMGDDREPRPPEEPPLPEPSVTLPGSKPSEKPTFLNPTA